MLSTSLYSPEYDALRVWLKNARKKAGLTQKQVASRLDVHHSIVGKLETGGRHFELFEFISYCDALNIEPADGFRVALNSYRKTNKRS